MPAPQNLGELNELLSQINMPQLTGEQFRALRENRPRNQLLTAASNMTSDSGARNYVAKAMREIGIKITAANDADGASGGQTAAPQAQTSPAQPVQQAPAPARASAPVSAASDDWSDEPPLQARSDSDSASDRFNYNMHIYGGKAALCFEPADTRGGDYTVSLDSATATQPRSYDWSSKLRIQMTRNELPVVAGVLLGLIPKCEYKNHGPNNDKGFSLEDQGRKIFIRTWAKDHPVRAVPVEPEDAYRIATLILRQMGLNAPWMSASDIIQTIRMVVARRVAP